MPNWQDIANAIGRGMFGEEIQDYKAKKQAMAESAERMGFARDENRRAGEQAARQADEFEFSKQQRPLLLKQLQQQIDTGALSLKDAQNKLALFDAEGGVEGEATRRKQQLGREEQTHKQSMKESNARIQSQAADQAFRQNQEKRQAELHALELEGRKLDNELAKRTQEARVQGINTQNDPDVKKAQRLRALIDAAKIATDDETYQELMDEIKILAIERKVGAAQQTSAAAANPNAVQPSAQSGMNRLKMGGL